MQNNMKERLQQAKNRIDSKQSHSTSFNFGSIKGDTGVREVEIEKLIPAPKEWNFYKPLSDNKMTELIDSILSKDLLTPIVVWEKEDDKYMILAGHNRVQAYEMLYLSTRDNQYLNINATIKKKDEIDEIEAREIIIDTNWVQRQLSDIEKSMSINFKYGILLNDKKGYDGSGRVRDIIAKEYNISGRQVDNYRRLHNLIPELKDMITNNTLQSTYALKLVSYDEDMQRYIYSNFKDCFSRKYMKNLKHDMSKDEINEVFSDREEACVELKFKVPMHLKDLVNNAVKELLEQNT
ncbi:ParB N-terminal domain-containing protein [Lutibacter sp. B2]|nr:ParB N-terminal domain-containing protein [Lutibacter sp. B2]